LFNSNGKSLFTASTNHVVTEWSVENGEKIREFIGEEGSSITSLAYSECSINNHIKINKYLEAIKNATDT